MWQSQLYVYLLSLPEDLLLARDMPGVHFVLGAVS